MLSQNTKKDMIKFIMDCMIEGSLNYSDVQRDIVLYGYEYKGVNNMTDEELIEEYKTHTCEDESEDELLLKALSEVGIHKMISE